MQRAIRDGPPMPALPLFHRWALQWVRCRSIPSCVGGVHGRHSASTSSAGPMCRWSSSRRC
eukprot:864051-Lingulodinium_polyedra.AAC.1